MMNRIEAKANAKSLLRGKPVLEVLIFFVILFGIRTLPQWLSWWVSPFRSLFWHILNGDLQWVIWELLHFDPVVMVLSACISVIAALAGLLFSAGMIRCALRMCRGDQTVRAADTLKAFDKLGKYILISLFQKLLLVLWNLPAAALVAGAVYTLMKGVLSENLKLPLVSISLVLAAIIWSVFISVNKQLQYFFSYYVCEDNPELGAIECVRRSGELTAGHKLDLIAAQLSFIGWNLLDLTFISRVFTTPYRCLTYAAMYRQLSRAEDSLRQSAVSLAAEDIQSTAAAVAKSPAIEFISGEYAGTQVPASDGKEIRVGRDPRQAHIVLAHAGRYISGLHCGVRYDNVSNCYFVTDYSTNGTFTGGVRLPVGSVSLQRGTVIKLADGEVLCRLA